MHFSIDYTRKIIFGWSPKCGCTHIKNLFLFLTTGKVYNTQDVHNLSLCNLPPNLLNYTILLFIRNPYKRIISGFLEKYKQSGSCEHLWNIPIRLTFANFVNNLTYSRVIDQHHFEPQINRLFFNRLYRIKKIIYDIENIDYAYIENLYKIIIPDNVKMYRGDHCATAKKITNYFLYDLLMREYADYKPTTRLFYNNHLKFKIDKYYALDFYFFKIFGFKYELI